MNDKKNLPLILGLLIPLLMIAFITISIYIPRIFVSPKYNFLYLTNKDYYGMRMYSVVDGRLVEKQQPAKSFPAGIVENDPEFYIHNVTKNESTPISFQEASKLTLNPNINSPDNYKVESGNASGGFSPFYWYSRDYESQYITGKYFSKKLNVKTTGYNYYASFQFLGWLIP